MSDVDDHPRVLSIPLMVRLVPLVRLVMIFPMALVVLPRVREVPVDARLVPFLLPRPLPLASVFVVLPTWFPVLLTCGLTVIFLLAVMPLFRYLCRGRRRSGAVIIYLVAVGGFWCSLFS